MCNAYNHPPGCTCGWGGFGHSGRSYGGWHNHGTTLGGGSHSLTFKVSYSYGRSMRDLAAELGYSVIFPTICRYCGELIYLYANPNGGFAIFDSLGIPWPKHDCWGIDQDSRDYTSVGDTYSKSYRLHVPEDAPTTYFTSEGVFTGTVVYCTGTSILGSRYTFWTGTHLVELWASADLSVGKCFEGEVQLLQNAAVLTSVVDMDSGEAAIPLAAASTLPSRTLPIADLEKVWQMQSDLAYVDNDQCATTKYLNVIIEATLAGHPIVALIGIQRLLQVSGGTLPSDTRSWYMVKLIDLLENLHLLGIFPSLVSGLSSKFLGTLNHDAQTRLHEAITIAKLKNALESSRRHVTIVNQKLERSSEFTSTISKFHDVSLGETIEYLRKQLRH